MDDALSRRERKKTQSTAAAVVGAVAAAACLRESRLHDGPGLKGLRRSVRNPHNYPFIGLGGNSCRCRRSRSRSRALTEAISCITQHFF